jgi:hypothetical protein
MKQNREFWHLYEIELFNFRDQAFLNQHHDTDIFTSLTKNLTLLSSDFEFEVDKKNSFNIKLNSKYLFNITITGSSKELTIFSYSSGWRFYRYYSYELIQAFNQFRIDYNHNIEKIIEIENQQIKDEKIKQIAIQNIQLFVKTLMKDSEYQYHLEMEKTRIVLNIKLKRKQQLSISLPHKTFTQKIRKILPTIQKVATLLDEVEIGVRIQGYGNNINWKNVK